MELFKLFGSVSVKDSASNALDKIGKNAKNLDDKMKKIGDNIAGFGKKMSLFVTAPVVGAGVAAFKLASDMEESLNKVNVAFGDNASEVQKWSGTTLKNFGIAKNSALDMSALFGDMATSMGLTTGQASDMAMSLTGLAGDLASFKNIELEQAMNALKGVFTGETESLKNLGVVMTQTNLQSFAMSQGIQKNIQDMTEAEKINLRYAYILNSTQNAQGDFARTNEGAANQMRIFTESLKELGATFGAYLLPIITNAISKVNEFVEAFGNLSETQQKTILIVGGLVAVIGPLLIVVGKAISLFVTLKPVLIAIGGAIAGISAPVWITIGAVTALIAIFVLLWKKNEAFRNGVIKIWESIKKFFVNSVDYIGKTISDKFNAILNFWRKWGDEIVFVVLGMWKIISNLFTTAYTFLRDKTVEGFKKIYEPIKNFFVTSTKNTKTFLNKFRGYFEIALDFISNIYSKFTSFVSNKIDAIKNKIVGFGQKIREVFIALLGKDLPQIQQDADKIANSVGNTFEKIPNKVKDIFANTKEETLESMEEISENTEKSIEDTFSPALFKTIGADAGKSLADGLETETENGLESMIESVNNFVDDYKNKIDDMGMAIMDALKNRYQSEEDEQRNSYEKQFSILQKQTDKNIAQYDRELLAKLRLFDDGTNEQINAIKSQIENIQNQTEAEEQELARQEYLKELAEKQKALALAESVEQQQKLAQDLNEFISKEERRRIKEERADQVESLRNKIDLIRQNREIERQQIVAETEERKKAEIFKMEFVKNGLESQLQSTLKHYETLKNEESLQHEARMILSRQNNDEIIKLLETYNPKWQKVGQSFGEMLLDGLESRESQIKATINRLLNAVERARSLSASLGSYNAIQSYNVPAMATGVTSGGTTLNINNATIMNDRDADKFGKMIVDRLKTLGVR